MRVRVFTTALLCLHLCACAWPARSPISTDPELQDDQRASRPLRKVLGTCEAPTPALRFAVTACRLDDGTPVFVARSRTERPIRVFAADVPYPNHAFVRSGVAAYPGQGFVAVNPSFADVRARGAPLDRYEADASASGLVRVGERFVPRSRVALEARWGGALDAPVPSIPSDAAHLVPLHELGAHEGEIVAVDAGIVFWGNRPARACKVTPQVSALEVPCEDHEPIVGPPLYARDEQAVLLGGPLRARIRDGNLTDVVLLGSAVSSRVLVDYAVIQERRRLEEDTRLRPEAVVALGWLGGRGAHHGIIDLRWSLARWLGPARGLREARDLVLGNTLGVGARLRGGVGSNGEVGALTQVSVVPILDNRIDAVRLPSLLGLVVPEVGVRVETRGRPRGVVGFDVPVRYLFVPLIHGVQVEATVFWLPADGAAELAVSAGYLFR